MYYLLNGINKDVENTLHETVGHEINRNYRIHY